MRRPVLSLVFLLVILLLPAIPAGAQSTTAAREQGEVVSNPVCFNVINLAPYTIVGTIATDYMTTADGTRARHRANFRLATKEKTNFCSSGPFYPGRKLDFNIHTLIPLFHCFTRIDGDIVVHGEELPDGAGTKTWADCR